LEGKWLKKGAHINAVGASSPNTQELSLSILTQSPAPVTLFTDRKESILKESGFFINGAKAGLLKESDIDGAELCDVVTGQGKRRQNNDHITIFKSLGIAIEDIASGYYVYQVAKENRKKSKL